MDPQELNRELGNIDIYLLDQILKGRFNKSMKILDAGCGEGRNSHYFIKNDFEIYGMDNNPSAIRMIKMVVRSMGFPDLTENFKCEELNRLSFDEHAFDAVICSAVLHFSQDEKDFWGKFYELDRVLKPGGLLFVRMADDLGSGEENVFFLMNGDILSDILNNYTLLEPYKSVNVKGKRSMNVLVIAKNQV